MKRLERLITGIVMEIQDDLEGIRAMINDPDFRVWLEKQALIFAFCASIASVYVAWSEWGVRKGWVFGAIGVAVISIGYCAGVAVASLMRSAEPAKYICLGRTREGRLHGEVFDYPLPSNRCSECEEIRRMGRAGIYQS